MQLTRAADYAVRVMIHLAGQPPETRASRSDLAEAAQCPDQFLSKVLQSLTKAGLVVSHRGNTGGFELAAAHRNASILEIVEAVEGPVRLNLCLVADDPCALQGRCPVQAVWYEAQEAMVSVLRRATIAGMAERAAAMQARPAEEAQPVAT